MTTLLNILRKKILTCEVNSRLPRKTSLKNISINQFVILQHNDKQYRTKIIETKESQMVVIAQCYEPPLPLSSYISVFNKLEKKREHTFQKYCCTT